MKQMDLFDMPAAKGLVGGRQSDLEELIAWEKSLAAAVFAKDKKKADAWVANIGIWARSHMAVSASGAV